MSTRHYNEYDPDREDPLPPPAPPQLMKLSIHSDGVIERTFRGVTESSLAGPSTFRFVMLDGSIRLFDMSGRDFVLVPDV